MITIRRTVVEESTITTPEEIAAHVAAEYRRRTEAAPFKPGDQVAITNRDGIPGQFMAGDVGTVMLCDPEFSPLTTLLGLNADGVTIQFPVKTANLRAA
jgi:hypothetical protein